MKFSALTGSGVTAWIMTKATIIIIWMKRAPLEKRTLKAPLQQWNSLRDSPASIRLVSNNPNLEFQTLESKAQGSSIFEHFDSLQFQVWIDES